MKPGALYVGAANDIIPKANGVDDPAILAQAKAKSITGVPAYQANCGGIAAIAVEDAGGTKDDAIRYMRGVYRLVKDTLAEAQRRGVTPEEVAADRASRHFAQFVKTNNIAL